MAKPIDFLIYKDDGNIISEIYHRTPNSNGSLFYYLNTLSHYKSHLLSIGFTRNPHTGLISRIIVHVKSSFPLNAYMKHYTPVQKSTVLDYNLIDFCYTDRDRKTFTIVRDKLKAGRSLYIANKPQVKEHDIFRASLTKGKPKKVISGRNADTPKKEKKTVTVTVKTARGVIEYEL